MKNKKAFTLIELLVVVLIIGILSAVALPQYQKAVVKTRFVQLQIIGRALYDAQQRYYLANSSYAEELDLLDVLPEGTLSEDKKIIKGTNWSCKYGEREITCDILIGNADTPTLNIVLFRNEHYLRCRARNDYEETVCKTYTSTKGGKGEGYQDYLLN